MSLKILILPNYFTMGTLCLSNRRSTTDKYSAPAIWPPLSGPTLPIDADAGKKIATLASILRQAEKVRSANLVLNNPTLAQLGLKWPDAL